MFVLIPVRGDTHRGDRGTGYAPGRPELLLRTRTKALVCFNSGAWRHAPGRPELLLRTRTKAADTHRGALTYYYGHEPRQQVHRYPDGSGQATHGGDLAYYYRHEARQWLCRKPSITLKKVFYEIIQFIRLWADALSYKSVCGTKACCGAGTETEYY
jgi:hypothetical protein